MNSINDVVKEAQNFLGEKYFEGLEIRLETNPDKDYLKVVRKNNEVTIFYGQKASLFRGLTLVKEKYNENHYDVTFHKHFDTNCWMIDVSRNAVMKKDEVKKIILMMALFGLNRLMLYTEDTYEIDNHPYFGYLRGRYTAEDLKEFVEYGESLGVELVPCIETLDHLARIFHYDAFAKIQDGPSNLNVGEEETYVFIEALIKKCRECFKTNVIHVGMDECMNLGLGKYLLKHGVPKDRIKLFNDHLRRVIDICKKYDFKPMIWSDMYFRLIDDSGNYYTKNVLTPEIINIIPKDADLVYWDYYHDDVATYEDMLKKHLKTNNKILFAGGAWNWFSFAPFTKIAVQRSKIALEVMLKHNVKDVFVTTWGDFGAECSNYTVLPCLATFSMYDFEGKDNEESLKSLFKAVTDEEWGDFALLDLGNEPNGVNKSPDYNCSHYFLYQDPMLGLFDAYVKDSFSKKYDSYLPILEKVINKNTRFSYLYKTLYDLIKVLVDKVDLGVKLRKAYKENDKTRLTRIKDEVIPRLLNSLKDFEKSFEKRWKIENKSFGHDVIDGRLGYLKNRLQTTMRVLDDYLNKRIEKIEELEEEILPYSINAKGDELFVGAWPLIVSPCEV